MRGSTHLTAGIAVGLTVARARGADLDETVIMVVGAGLASLVPDWLQINIPGLNRTIKGAFGHRGFSHWGLTALGIYLAMIADGPMIARNALPVALGWLSHLLLDSLNRPGIPFFWPMPWRLHLASVKTGARLDKIANAWLAIVAVAQAVVLGIRLIGG